MSGDDPGAPAWARGHEGGPYYHHRLLGDPHRMAAYERAIRQLVRPGDVVLDLGAGTGLLAMWAARRGARRVYAVESTGVAGVAEQLVRANGLDHVVRVIRADATTLEPVEPVDLVVAEFMGTFVVDDGMLWAVEAAGRWLRPGGRFCPGSVALTCAPVEAPGFEPLELWERPAGGLRLDPATAWARHADYRATLAPAHLLAEPATFATLRPPTVWVGFDRTLRFEITRPGRLRGIAGWFRAELAPDVTLSSGPDTATHWGQVLLPLPPTSVEPGDQLEVRLSHALADASDARDWRWSGSLWRGGERLAVFDLSRDAPASSAPAPDPPPPAGPGDPLSRGCAAFEAGDYRTAAEAFEAVVAGLGPADDGDAAELWENLGLAYAFAGRARASVFPLLRALDGDPAGREQSARFLVDAYFRLGWDVDGERALAAYEAAFGPHPAGWHRTPQGS